MKSNIVDIDIDPNSTPSFRQSNTREIRRKTMDDSDLDIIETTIKYAGSKLPLEDQAIIKEAMKRLERIRTRQHASADVPAWQDISTAPRDGTPFIGYSPTHGVKGNVRWSERRQDFDLDGWSSAARDWTDWMPEPAPPNRIEAAAIKDGGG